MEERHPTMCIPESNRRSFLRTAAGAGLAVAGLQTVVTPGTALAQEHTTELAERVALTNVRVFDGSALTAPRTVVISQGLIGITALGAQKIDCAGAVLLPGLIDAHLHLQDLDTLRQLTGAGVTTGLDMASFPPSVVDALRRRPGLTDIRSACTPAVAPGSPQSQIPAFPADGVVTGPQQAQAFVRARIAEGADYIKIIVDEPGLAPDTIAAITKAAHTFGKRVMAHATTVATVERALTAGVDTIHHVPLDSALSARTAARYASGGRVCVPTLTMMEGFARLGIPGMDYAAAEGSVAALHRAGVPVLAGTDANRTAGIPVQPAYGSSLHHELELLVDAGLTPREALRSATSLPAASFGLRDRGAVLPGYRADLVLIDGDPLTDITATRRVLRVWAGGVGFTPAS
ncbi:amidohydrolase family protein [Streptomyces sp. NPDC049954]|uniref:amidohydrolase family protein n=1 Tax=Streptomyces sp. NPDC049954 TaxID=3155779 RepID=UPI00342ECCCD